MRIATVEQSRQIDQTSQTEYSLSGEILMESAGALAAREIEQAFFPELKRGLIGIVCGPGNNGGDGLVVARHLHSSGYRDLVIFLAAPRKSRSDLFSLQVDRCDRQGLRIIDVFETPDRLERLRSCVLVVDALFGIGFRADMDSQFARVIEMTNTAQCPVVSLDTPSGLDCDRGTIATVAVKATMTVAFGLAKPGFFVNEGPSRVGKLRVLAIGFPFEVFRKTATTHFGFGEKLARRYLPKRPDTSNKSDHGQLVVFAGQPGTWGAGILAAMSAYRMGVGYVTLASFAEPLEVLRSHPEIMTATVDHPKVWNTEMWKAVAIGPGLGVGQKTADLINKLRTTGFENVVVDADAITSCVDYDLFPLPKTWIMTPHAGELARVLKTDAQTIEKDRYTYALQASRQVGCHVLLKGFRSVLAYQDRCMVIMAGNSALAKAGTGDILTGMIAGLLAQKVEPVQATATAAYIHGRMADEWVRIGNDKRTLTASDLRDHLPILMARLAGGAIV